MSALTRRSTHKTATIYSPFYSVELGRPDEDDLPNQWHIGQLVTIAEAQGDFLGDAALKEHYGRTGKITEITPAKQNYRKMSEAEGSEGMTQTLTVQLDGDNLILKDVSVYAVTLAWNQVVYAAIVIAKKGSNVGSWKSRYVELYGDCIRYWASDKFDKPVLGIRHFTPSFTLLDSQKKGFNIGKISSFGRKFTLGGQPYSFGFGMRFGEKSSDVIWFSHKEEAAIDMFRRRLEETFVVLKNEHPEAFKKSFAEDMNESESFAVDADDAKETARLAQKAFEAEQAARESNAEAEITRLAEEASALKIQATVRGRQGRKAAAQALAIAMSTMRCEGELEKKGGTMGMWSTRYYVLSPEKCLFEFANKEAYTSYTEKNGVPRPSHAEKDSDLNGKMHHISHYELVFDEKQPVQFKLVSTTKNQVGESKDRLYRAKTTQERNAWVEQIQRLLPKKVDAPAGKKA